MDIKNHVIILAAFVLLPAFVCSASAKTIYVDANAPGADNGTSWENAYNFLQDALADANSSEKPVEIRAAQGIYQPDRSAAEPNGTGDRHATFQLINGLTLKGGYAGFGQPDPNARDIDLYETILSGDLDGNDVDVNDPSRLLDEPSRGENCITVVTAGLNDETAALDGLTISGGNDTGYAQASSGQGMLSWDGAPTLIESSPRGYGISGSGMFIWDGDPTLTKCTFRENATSGSGGGLANWLRGPTASGGSPTLIDCVFVHNSAGNVGGGMDDVGSPRLFNCTFKDNHAGDGGGGMSGWGEPRLTDCTFESNQGGGMYNSGGSPFLTRCKFIRNRAEEGAGMSIYLSDTTLISCVFAGNVADQVGGGLLSKRSLVQLRNCTFAHNSAPDGKAVACDSRVPSTIDMMNCILRDGEGEIWNNDGSAIGIDYSNVEGGWPGQENIDADPCFADPDNGDYHPRSQAGRWDPNEERWVTDEVTSPCIDAGNPMSPIGHEPFPNGGIINMGAYGGTAEASKSYFGKPPCEVIVAGDINGDCRVDFLDFRIMALHWMWEE